MSDAAKIVDAFIAETWGETRPEPYRKAMIAMVEQATGELEKRIGELEAERDANARNVDLTADRLKAAEQVLTTERQRREECEKALRPFAQLAKTQVMLGLNIADYKHAAAYFTRHSSSLNEPGNGRSE